MKRILFLLIAVFVFTNSYAEEQKFCNLLNLSLVEYCTYNNVNSKYLFPKYMFYNDQQYNIEKTNPKQEVYLSKWRIWPRKDAHRIQKGECLIQPPCLSLKKDTIAIHNMAHFYYGNNHFAVPECSVPTVFVYNYYSQKWEVYKTGYRKGVEVPQGNNLRDLIEHCYSKAWDMIANLSKGQKVLYSSNNAYYPYRSIPKCNYTNFKYTDNPKKADYVIGFPEAVLNGNVIKVTLLMVKKEDFVPWQYPQTAQVATIIYDFEHNVKSEVQISDMTNDK